MIDRLRPATVKYAPRVAFLAAPVARCCAISLTLHLLVLLLVSSWRSVPAPSEPAPIVVSFAPPANRTAERSAPVPKGAIAPMDKARPAPAQIAKNAAPPTLSQHEPAREVTKKKEPPPAAQTPKKEDDVVAMTAPAPAPRPAAREEFSDKAILAERELPTVKQLLPPLYSSDGGTGRSRVPLESKEPQYVSYFSSIKRSIDAHWKYPELALRYGLQGRLIVEFEIMENGHLEGLRVIRSSGSALLDDEAVRAIRSAAPFAPIPRWIQQKPLPITARMEYHDGRLTRPAP